MLRTARRPITLATMALLAVSACSSGASPSPTAAPSASTAPAASTPASAAASEAAASPSAAGSPAASVVATIPAEQLITAEKLTICSDIPYPPLEFFDAQGNPTGSDIDLGAAIASRLGLTEAVNNTVFDTIIPALLGGKCDIIISDQNITADRVKQVDMIPYFQAGQAFVVAAGNPKNLMTTADLCGLAVGAETGTTEVDYLNGAGDYKGKGLNAACTSAGKPAINVKQFEKDSDAVLALSAGQVDAYFADYPVAANYANSRPDAFQVAPIPQLAPALVGISVAKDAAHKDLEKGVQAALISLINDGTYLDILKKYKDDAGAITADVAGQINKISQ
ncbi:MAG TPA: ABC transporter substrate-binding protein [Candidatus Limnocylindrales bacterium]|nr:ABC transporter substrate-binding protein [Candidatus Limnocylindrales bacterium]